jgi:hypothetical protein
VTGEHDIQALSADWSTRSATLYRSPKTPGEETRFGSTISADVLAAALDRAARTVKESPPERDGYAVVLHEPDEPTPTDEYVLWRPESEQVGWFDPAFGIEGSVRFVDVADAAATTLGDRLRCWHPESTPESVEPLGDVDLPESRIEPVSPLSDAEQESIIDDLRDSVDAARDAELAANRERHERRGGDPRSTGSATGPFVSLGQAGPRDGMGRFHLQLAEGGRTRGNVDLVSDEDIYPESLFLLDCADDVSEFPLVVRTKRVQDAGVVVAADRSCDVSPERVEELLVDGDRELRLTHLLNPVPFDRRTDALDSVAGNPEKLDLLTGNRPVEFAADELSVPSVDLPLNEYQERALKWADDAEDLLLVHGPPGTGKTRTLTAYALHAAWHGESVLVTAHSNQAVDNLLVGDSTLDEPEAGTLHDFATRGEDEGGDDSVSIARVGHNSTNEVVREHYTNASVADADIVAATTSGAAQFETDVFDVGIVDEATQASRPASAIVLDAAQKLVLSGDHKQLSPYAAGESGTTDADDTSLFEYLLERYGEDVAVLLGRQYRMHEAIAEFPNGEFYDGRLETAERNRDWQIPGLDPLRGVDVRGEERRGADGNSFYNPAEAEVVVDEVRTLVEAGVDPADVGVIAMYSAQVEHVRSRLGDSGVPGAGRVTVDTVDSFQGGEREAIVVSFVRSNDAGNSGFLTGPDEGPRRLNVALTRARKRLVLVGNFETLSTVAPHRGDSESCASHYAALRERLAVDDLLHSRD